MLGALVYLRFTSAKNWLLTRLRRLRQPKQLAGALAFAAYFWFFFLRHWVATPPDRAPRRLAAAQAMQAAHLELPLNWLAAATAFGALALLVIFALMWIVPAQRGALGFTEAEIAFLFPAPVTRRALVHFRLLSGQFHSLLGAIIMMLISNRWSFLGGNALTHAFGWWFVFSALNLHFSGATLTLTRLSNAGRGAGLRRLYVFLLLAAVLVATFWRLPAIERLPATGPAVLRPFTDWVIAVTGTAPLGWVLWPFKLVLGPFLAPDGRSFLLALAPALLVIGAHYLWVVQTAVAFEDASIDSAQKRTARLEAWRAGRRPFSRSPTQGRRNPFFLAGTGRAEFAFLWKNLLSTWPYFTVRTFLIAAAAIAIGCSWLNAHPVWSGFAPGIGAFAGAIAVYLLVIGPQLARQDIRSDLVNADILKTYPLPGWQIVLGELLTPVAILTGVLWLALLTVVLAFHPTQPGFAWLTPQIRLATGLWLAPIVPALVALQLLVPNAAAILFPAWFQASRTRGGPEVAGQRMIFFFAQLLTMVLALLPAVALAGVLIFILQWFAGAAFAVSVGGLAALVILVGEVWCGIWLLGERFEKFDLSAELRP
ncbi:MAG TPA: putative ABC exporter domain-containing protein [Opitutaceae bacterium]|nr:putative ABC exporter domain-containing protein [Opitutaceae bacterium]